MRFRGQIGVTLVELMVALAIASILILGVIAAFQTTQRTAAIGEAREQIYQNARVALDLMSREIKNAYIDHRNRDLVFVSADGLAGRLNSIVECYALPSPPPYFDITFHGLGNAQTPFGIDLTGSRISNELMRLYADETFGYPLYSVFSVKAINDIYTLSPGPPDRLDFSALTSQYEGAGSTNQARLRFVRYMVTTETFVDDVDNDFDRNVDENDNSPPGSGSLGAGDLIPVDRREDFNPVTKKILALSLFQLHRVVDNYSLYNTYNPYNARVPARTVADWDPTGTDENIGSYIYDVQFEFYGRIAVALNSDGCPEIWGTGWGYQDARGEDIGLDGDPEAIGYDPTPSDASDDQEITVQEGSDAVSSTGPVATTWTSSLVGGKFITWPSGTGEFDVTDSSNEVYRISAVSDATHLTLDKVYVGPYNASGPPRSYSGYYRIIEPTQANGVLDGLETANSEDRGADGLMGDPLDDSTGIPNNVSNNNGNQGESSVGEGNHRLDSRVMGVWDSRSPDPRNPRRAAELDGQDNDNDSGMTAGGGLGNNGVDDDFDGQIDDRTADYADGANFVEYATPEVDDPDPPGVATDRIDETNDLVDNDAAGTDGVVDDRFYEPAGKPEGVDEPDEANPFDDSLPQAVRITIAIRDSQQSLEPVVLSTTVWLSTAR